MTRILLPVLLAIFTLLGLSIVVPIFLREQLTHWRRARNFDEWAQDIPEDR